jgi:hypothetical protein
MQGLFLFLMVINWGLNVTEWGRERFGESCTRGWAGGRFLIVHVGRNGHQGLC